MFENPLEGLKKKKRFNIDLEVWQENVFIN